MADSPRPKSWSTPSVSGAHSARTEWISQRDREPASGRGLPQASGTASGFREPCGACLSSLLPRVRASIDSEVSPRRIWPVVIEEMDTGVLQLRQTRRGSVP